MEHEMHESVIGMHVVFSDDTGPITCCVIEEYICEDEDDRRRMLRMGYDDGQR